MVKETGKDIRNYFTDLSSDAEVKLFVGNHHAMPEALYKEASAKPRNQRFTITVTPVPEAGYKIIFEGGSGMLESIRDGLSATKSTLNDGVLVIENGSVAVVLNDMAATNAPDGKPIISKAAEEALALRISEKLQLVKPAPSYGAAAEGKVTPGKEGHATAPGTRGTTSGGGRY